MEPGETATRQVRAPVCTSVYAVELVAKLTLCKLANLHKSGLQLYDSPGCLSVPSWPSFSCHHNNTSIDQLW